MSKNAFINVLSNVFVAIKLKWIKISQVNRWNNFLRVKVF